MDNDTLAAMAIQALFDYALYVGLVALGALWPLRRTVGRLIVSPLWEPIRLVRWLLRSPPPGQIASLLAKLLDQAKLDGPSRSKRLLLSSGFGSVEIADGTLSVIDVGGDAWLDDHVTKREMKALYRQAVRRHAELVRYEKRKENSRLLAYLLGAAQPSHHPVPGSHREPSQTN